MPLTPQEQAELASLESDPTIAAKGPTMPSKGLTPAEQAELASLESEVGHMAPVSSGETMGDRLESGAKAGIGSVPFIQSAWDVTHGKNPYELSPEGMARLGGDVGGTAAAIATGGIPALAKFAGANALLEASGFSPATRKASEFVDRIIPDAQQGDMVFDPSSKRWVKSVIPGVPQNMFLNTPQAALQTGIESIPAILAGGLATKGMGKDSGGNPPPIETEIGLNKGMISNPGSMGSAPSTAEILKAARDRNIPVTQGALEGGKAAIREKQFAMNPNTASLAEEFYKRQNAAQKSAMADEASKGFGDPYLSQELQTGNFDKARILGDVKGRLKDVRSEAGKMVGEARQNAYESLPIVAGLGKTFKDALTELGQKYNIPSDVSAMPPINRQGVSQMAGKIYQNVINEASQVKTLKQAQGVLSTLDDAINGAFKKGDIANKNAPLFTEMRQRINGIMDSALKNVSPEAATELSAAKSKFAKIADPTKELYADLKRSDHQEAFGKLINSQGKVGKVQAVKMAFADSDPSFIKQFQARALQELALRSMKGEVLDTNALAREWGPKGIFKDGLKEAIFTPQQIKAVDEHLAIQKMNMGPREAMGTQATGGSQTQAKMALGKALGGAIQHVPGIGTVAKLASAVKAPFDRYAAAKYFGNSAEAPEPRTPRSGFLARQTNPGLMAAFLAAKQASQNQPANAR